MFVCQERGLQRWVYHWTDAQGIAGHVRGVDVFRFQDGKIAEKLSYIKGVTESWDLNLRQWFCPGGSGGPAFSPKPGRPPG
jgi:hypothetical protein